MTNPVVSSLPRGRNLVRALICRQAGALGESGVEFATRTWGAYHAPAIEKAATAMMLGSDFGEPAALEFLDAVREKSLIGRMPLLRRVPFNLRLLSMASGTRGFWVSETRPAPVTRATLAGTLLEPRKVSAVIVASKESLSIVEPLAEAALHRDLERAVAETIDTAFIDAGNAGVVDTSPASVTNAAASYASTGNVGDDLAALFAAFDGDLSSAYLVTDPTTATEIALARDAGGNFSFPDAGPRGGSILGIPLLTSRGSPRDTGGGQIALIDASAIALAFDQLAMDIAEHASLQMSDTPGQGNPADIVNVSLWQQNLCAFRSQVRANWTVQRAGAVVVVVGAGYSTGSGT